MLSSLAAVRKHLLRGRLHLPRRYVLSDRPGLWHPLLHGRNAMCGHELLSDGTRLRRYLLPERGVHQ